LHQFLERNGDVSPKRNS